MQSSDERTAYESNIQGENQVQPIEFGFANIYLIKTESGHILVDAGVPNMGKKLDEAFERAGVDPKSVQLIIATHGHLDHIGSIAYAQKATGAKILCHQAFSENMMKGVAEPAIARNLLGRLMKLLTAFMGNKFEGAKPDILMDDEFDLSEYGIGGKVIHTPGHSPSSVAIMLGSGEALVGDLVRDEGSGKIGIGMFYDDKQMLLESLERVAAFEPRIIYLSHGDRIDNNALRDCIEANK